MQREPTVSVVVPAYNEEGNLEQLAQQIRSAMAAVRAPYEVLFIDDGSTDDSFEVLRRIALRDRRVRLLRLPRNCGQSAALAVGFRASRGSFVVTLDADLQNDPRDIPRVLDPLDRFDATTGVRQRRRDSWQRRLSSSLADRVRRRLLGDGIHDIGCSLKAYRRQALLRVPVFDGMHRFLPALVKMGGGRVKEVSVSHRPRRTGRSKYGSRNRLWKARVDLWGVRWLQRRWIDLDLAEELDLERRPGVAPNRQGSGTSAYRRPGSSRSLTLTPRVEIE